ncbi:MAG TPA: hydantoinase B/oxoprolinase family protein [Pirellulales bacterium]|jgi:5-oxoprolinase (ATP-hydrolysing)|nr:hydantoinase B/oxoprolinase family protein [Pirellulales bacterium]
MNADCWEFWIDVGGTFTDCFGRRPDGSLVRHKLLSSGVTKGTVADGSTPQAIVDPARAADPAHFWRSWRLELLNAQGRTMAESIVADSDGATGALELTAPLAVAPTPGSRYELSSPAEAPLVAIRYLLGLAPNEAVPPVRVRLGTTRGTNALLTRRGARVALVTTRGFGDVLTIGYQNRPRLFDLAIRKPAPLTATSVEIDERVAADGTVLRVPDRVVIRRQLAQLRSGGVESLAIALLHSVSQPAHEQLVAEIAREVGFSEISLSSEVAPLVKLVPRADTTTVDAYLNPVLRRYVEMLRQSLPGSELQILTSAGGLVTAERFAGKDSILSGPAGGVVGFSRVAQAAGAPRAIGFDMGGTSTDVSRFDGKFDLEYETEKAGVRVVAPMLAIETVAAGGGSICRFDGVKLVVGPDSAGADPGPACYGRGGPLTITDVNFYLGRISAEHFPFALSRAAVESRLQEIAQQLEAAGTPLALTDLAEGFVRLSNAHMAKAIRSISLAKGYDARDYLLVPFGGAGGQHACALAAELQIPRILCHPDAGLLSAYGMGLADVTRHRTRGIYRPYTASAVAGLETVFAAMAVEALAEVIAEGVASDRIEIRRRLELRYQGVDQTLVVHARYGSDCAAAFAAEHRKLYGYVHAGRALEIVAARIEVCGRSSTTPPASHRVASRLPAAAAHGPIYWDGRWHQAQVFTREQLTPGDAIAGPALIAEASSTTVVDPGWRAEVLSQGELLLERTVDDGRQPPASQAAAHHADVADPVLLEIFNHRLAGIADEMGLTLRQTASSVNVKERLDFSCAIFTAVGDLVVNAQHIPVHLGAMSETVKRALADNPQLRPGDVLVTNDPYHGGSHLPDVTVITPVHDASGELRFFTASRAHHAEIGGIAPGSMPPGSRNLAEEGVVIRNFHLFTAGEPHWDELGEVLAAGPYPSRDVATNLADSTAQVAANRRGARDLDLLVEHYGWPVVSAYMEHIQQAAAEKVSRALARFAPGKRSFVDYLDDGSPIAVTIQLEAGRAVFDFAGTGPVLSGNLNANRAITTSAVMYVLRTLVDEDIPLNQGMLRSIEIRLPECLLNPPEHTRPEQCAAVAGGNVETSQRVVDVLLGALDLAAASQGTMNNTVFGNERFGYYETVCGGAGATESAAGASAVHTHMTNTRLTDPEILERLYPVRLWGFAIRAGSGGAGAQPGGDGAVRRIEFLEPLEVSLVTSRRGPYPPYGLQGGAPGALGRNTLLRADGSRETLPAQTQVRVVPGDQLLMETPGGGGWGTPAQG